MTGADVTNQRTGLRNHEQYPIGSWIRSGIRRFVIERKARGFTLMEMLVSLGLFSIVVVIAADLFITFQQLSRKTESLEHLVTDARFIVEQIAREIREGRIDYAQYSTPIAGPVTTLALLNRSQIPVEFNFTEVCSGDYVFPCVEITRGAGSPEELNRTDVDVQRMRFYIFPTRNPFVFDPAVGTYGANIQPRVTVYLSLSNGLSPGDANYIEYDVQTTISSRVYER